MRESVRDLPAPDPLDLVCLYAASQLLEMDYEVLDASSFRYNDFTKPVDLPFVGQPHYLWGAMQEWSMRGRGSTSLWDKRRLPVPKREIAHSPDDLLDTRHAREVLHLGIFSFIDRQKHDPNFPAPVDAPFMGVKVWTRLDLAYYQGHG